MTLTEAMRGLMPRVSGEYRAQRIAKNGRNGKNQTGD